VWVLLNLALSERGQCRFVGDQRNCRGVVQGKSYFPRWANGYHGVVLTAEVVVSLQDNMNKLKEDDISAYQLSKKKNGDRNTLLTRVIIIASAGQGLSGLDVLFGLLGGIRVGCLIIIWVLVRVAHDRLQQRGDGKSYVVMLK
jgi:hypothetical protein